MMNKGWTVYKTIKSGPDQIRPRFFNSFWVPDNPLGPYPALSDDMLSGNEGLPAYALLQTGS